jgi:nucleotide-binding universal stress UspA family protein
MAIKTILVPLDGSDSAYNALETALVIAKRFQAHISAIHVSQSNLQSATFVFASIPKALRESVEEEGQKALNRQADEIRSRFESFCQDQQVKLVDKPGQETGVTGSWIHEFGSVTETLIDYARLHDVTAFARPQKQQNVIHRGVLGDTLQTVMLEAGRPMIVVPPQWQARACEHAVIGWNHSQEASRALSMTIPWLLEMKKVTIVVARKREGKGGKLQEYLSWHGIDSEIAVLNRGSKSAGERILDICESAGGDFLVVGGYSTARAKERLFGGVTNYLLSTSNVITAIVH